MHRVSLYYATNISHRPLPPDRCVLTDYVILAKMSTRTVTTSRSNTTTQKKPSALAKQSEREIEDKQQQPETSRYKQGRKFLEQSAPSPLSDDDDDDEFSRDVRLEIEEDKRVQEEIKKNGGKKPRKKKGDVTDAQKQTEKTRRLFKKGWPGPRIAMWRDLIHREQARTETSRQLNGRFEKDNATP